MLNYKFVIWNLFERYKQHVSSNAQAGSRQNIQNLL